MALGEILPVGRNETVTAQSRFHDVGQPNWRRAAWLACALNAWGVDAVADLPESGDVGPAYSDVGSVRNAKRNEASTLPGDEADGIGVRIAEATRVYDRYDYHAEMRAAVERWSQRLTAIVEGKTAKVGRSVLSQLSAMAIVIPSLGRDVLLLRC